MMAVKAEYLSHRRLRSAVLIWSTVLEGKRYFIFESCTIVVHFTNLGIENNIGAISIFMLFSQKIIFHFVGQLL